MLTRRRIAAAAASLPAWPLAAATPPLSVGLLPYLSPAALLAAFRPLREHLERRLARTVDMRSSRDFATQADDVRRGAFDVAILPAHLARLAQLDWQWQVLVATVDMLVVQAMVRESSPLRAPTDLDGRRVGTLDPLTLTASVARRWIADQRVAPVFVTVPSINSGMQQLERGEIDVMVGADTQFGILPPEVRRRLRPIARIDEIPGPLWIARPALPRADVEPLRRALLDFEPDAGQAPSAANARMRQPDPTRLQQLDGYAAIARQALAAGPR